MNLLETTAANMHLDEGSEALERLLVSLYIQPGQSTRSLSKILALPVPIIAAAKNEMKKQGLLKTEAQGIFLSDMGLRFVLDDLGYSLVIPHILSEAINADLNDISFFKHELHLLNTIFIGRPAADVSLDQAKCTPETALKRALLCLKNHALVNRHILCVGDDDLISTAVCLIAGRLSSDKYKPVCTVTVIDIDQRVLQYIETVAEKYCMPIHCIKHNLRTPLPERLRYQFDCVFTDPPYTLPGVSLFLSRGLEAIKKNPGKYIFLSVGGKPPLQTLELQRFFCSAGLLTEEIYHDFNNYEGAQLLGSRSNLIKLRTTSACSVPSHSTFSGSLYTNDFRHPRASQR